MVPCDITSDQPTYSLTGAVVVDDAFDLAFATLFRERFAMLYRYLSRSSGDDALADDVAQESFLRLHRRGSMPDNPSAWLVSVANNIVRDERRSTSRREKLLTQWVSRDGGMDSPLSSEARMIQEECKAVVRRALGTLRPRDQRLLILRHEGFSYREIAEVLGIAPTSVGTLLVRATTALAKAYRELDHASE